MDDILERIMYGYLDESGAPGVATRPNDFLTVSLIVFADKESVNKCSESIDRLRGRLKLPNGYEFHHSRITVRDDGVLVFRFKDGTEIEG